MSRKNKQASANVSAESHDPIDTYVGKRLRQKRALSGLSQGRLGQMIGLTFQQIQKYEWGTNRIGAGRLYRLARLLNVPVQWFYEGMPPELLNSNGQTPIEISLNGNDDIPCQHETLNLVRAYYQIDDHNQRRKFVDLLKSFGKP